MTLGPKARNTHDADLDGAQIVIFFVLFGEDDVQLKT